MTGGQMPIPRALQLLMEGVAGSRAYFVGTKAERGTRCLNLTSDDQEEVLRALEYPKHFKDMKQGRHAEGYHYKWGIQWMVPTEDEKAEEECTIFVKFRVFPDEETVELTSFCRWGSNVY